MGATRFNQQAVVTGGELGENGDYRDEVLLFTLKGRLDSQAVVFGGVKLDQILGLNRSARLNGDI